MVHVERGDTIRIISARLMTPMERRCDGCLLDAAWPGALPQGWNVDCLARVLRLKQNLVLWLHQTLYEQNP